MARPRKKPSDPLFIRFLNLDIEKTESKQLMEILLSESKSKLPRKDQTSLLFGGGKPRVEETKEFQEEIKGAIEDLKSSHKPGHWIPSERTHDLLKMGIQNIGPIVAPNLKEKAINIDLIEIAPRHYKNIVCYSLINFLDQKRGIDKIQSCPECSMWFVSVKGKKYCTTRCQNNASTRLFRGRDPEFFSRRDA